MYSFNLVDASWIPCAADSGGAPRLLSLREVFAQAHELSNIADPSPAVTISVYRLLLAILHRGLDGPRSDREWQHVWERGQWDLDRISGYLDKWHDRFDLFDARYPFYQTPDLDPRAARPATQLTQERASDRNRALLFDHTPDDMGLTPAASAGYLIAQHNFAVGGLISLGTGEPRANKFAAAAPLLGGALVLTRGEPPFHTLFHTLMLNWVRYSREDGQPFPFKGDDKPAWEREGGARPEDRLPDGYADLLTWQSRRILLVPDTTPIGETRVRAVILMKGYQFAESFEQWSAETMTAFRKNVDPKAVRPWYSVGLSRDRAVWRDSQALFQSVAGVQSRPKTMNWLDRLMERNVIADRKIVPLEVYGLIPDQANILDWRRESLPLPLRLLRQEEQGTQELLGRLTAAIQRAEAAGRLFDATLIEVGSNPRKKFKSPMWVLCEELLAGMSGREPKRDDCATLARRFGVGVRYWSRLDTPFRRFVADLALPDDITVEDGATLLGMRALRTWIDAVRRIARGVFDEVASDLDTSGRALRAAALARRRFNFLITALTSPHSARALTDDIRDAEGVSA